MGGNCGGLASPCGEGLRAARLTRDARLARLGAMLPYYGKGLRAARLTRDARRVLSDVACCARMRPPVLCLATVARPTKWQVAVMRAEVKVKRTRKLTMGAAMLCADEL